MFGKSVPIAESFFDKSERKNILFTFEMNGIAYVVICNSLERTYDIHCLKYSFLVGSYLSKCKKDTDKVLQIAKKIIESNANHSEKYPLNGEHYTVNLSSSEAEGFELSRTGSISFFCEKKSLLPNIVKFSFVELTSVFLSIIFFQKYFYKLNDLIPSLPTTLCYGIIVLSSVLFPAFNFLVGKEYKRNFLNWFLIPFSWHSLLLLIDVEKNSLAIMCFASLFIGACYALAKQICSFKNKEIGLKERLLYFLQRTIKAIFVSMVVISLTFNISLLIEAKSKNDLKESELSNITKEYETACELLNDNTWLRTTYDEKKDILQAITDYECAITLNCSTATVEVKPMDDLNGSYNSSSNTIYIDSKLLETEKPITIINTLLHEIRHVYQHHICQLYSDLKMEVSEEKYTPLLNTAITISENLSNYVDGSSVGSFFLYYNQPVEVDARSWAKNEIIRYYSFITVTYV